MSPQYGHKKVGSATRWCGGMVFVVVAATAAADEPNSHALLNFDVAAADRAAQKARQDADPTVLASVIVRGRRSGASALPCLGCDGRVIVPMHRLQDFTEIVESLLVIHPPSRLESTEDRSLALAHEGTCIDGGFGCLAPK